MRGDWLDQAQDISERERQALIARARRRADGNAISIECVDCGDAIPRDRIKARPGCTRCVFCQEKHERGRRSR